MAILKLTDIRLSTIQQQMVEDNLKLVGYAARKFNGYIGKKGIELEDLHSIGTIGLIRAVARFDASSGTAFSSLAMPFIQGEISHYLRDKIDIIKTPRNCEALRVVSIDKTLKDDTSTTLIDVIPAPIEIQEPTIDDNLLRAIETLDRRDRDILVMTQINGCTNQITAAWLEVSAMTVTRQLRTAIARVKTVLTEQSKKKLPRKTKRTRNALPFVVDGVVNYPSKHRCIVCHSIFGLWENNNSYKPKTCSPACAAKAAIDKTPTRSPAWTEAELAFCDNLVGKCNLGDIYQELCKHNEEKGLPVRSRNSVKVKLTRQYRSLKVTEGDLSARELARQLDIPVDRIRVWLKNGLKSTKASNGRHRITREALTKFAKTNYHRFYGIDAEKLATVIDDEKVLKKCQSALPHINRIEVVRTDNKKKYRSLRAAAKAVGISKAHVLTSGWIQPAEYITDIRTKENPIDLQHFKTKRKLLDPKIKHKKRWKFLSPDGVEFETNNLALFAKVHGLQRALLALVWKGDKQQHAGWRRSDIQVKSSLIIDRL